MRKGVHRKYATSMLNMEKGKEPNGSSEGSNDQKNKVVEIPRGVMIKFSIILMNGNKENVKRNPGPNLSMEESCKITKIEI